MYSATGATTFESRDNDFSDYPGVDSEKPVAHTERVQTRRFNWIILMVVGFVTFGTGMAGIVAGSAESTMCGSSSASGS